jgi:outer membrane lipoprotein SlyB
MSSKSILIFLATSSLVALTGCGTSASKTPVYSTSQVGQMISEQKGEIIGVQDVVIKARSSSAGSTGVGARMGSAAVVAAVLGSPIHAAIAAGEMIGSAAGAGLDNQKGEELTILLKDGRTVVVVQPRGDVPYVIGDRVKILNSSSGSIYGEPTTQVLRDDVYAKTTDAIPPARF